jgi:hypothetical protein
MRLSRRAARQSVVPGLVASAAASAALLLGLGACTVHNDDSGGPSDGTVTVDWTIDDDKSGDDCNSNDATSIQITVIDSDGANAGTFEQSCASFATSIQLPPGGYTANAVLVDSSDHPRTTTIAINPFTVGLSGDLDIPIDFPQSSFL